MDCDGCSLCCLVADIPQMDAPSGTQCKNCTKEGCGIHSSRPDICRDYWCVFHKENLPDELHPNKCHIMFERLDGCDTYIGTVHPDHKHDWVSDAVNNFVDNKIKEGISVVINGDRKYIKSPQGIKQKDVINDLARAYGKWQSLHTQQI